MHRQWAWKIAALVLGLCGAARAAEGPTLSSSPFNGAQNPGFHRWGGPSTERPKPLQTSTSSLAKARASDTAAAVRAQEEANFLRRLAVCDKLREMANQTSDESLERQSYSLQQKAESVYKQRTSAGPIGLTTNEDERPRGGKR